MASFSSNYSGTWELWISRFKIMNKWLFTYGIKAWCYEICNFPSSFDLVLLKLMIAINYWYINICAFLPFYFFGQCTVSVCEDFHYIFNGFYFYIYITSTRFHHPTWMIELQRVYNCFSVSSDIQNRKLSSNIVFFPLL